MPTRYFTPKLFGFLRDLEENNDRTWFKANQDLFEENIREPALEFINDFAGPLQNISPHFSADSRKSGGSLFRIQRDTRFSKDKTPYKTNTGMHFRHASAKDSHAPGFYLHLEPSGCFMGVGLWRPESKVAYAIRQRIDDDPAAWKKATRSKRFTDVYTLEGDSLIRPPKGYGDDHPLIEDLKRKDFIASCPINDKQVLAKDFSVLVAQRFRAAKPLMAFLCAALNLQF